MTKISFSASKVLLGLSLTGLLSSTALGVDFDLSDALGKELKANAQNTNALASNEITIGGYTGGNIIQYFDSNNGKDFTIKKEHTNSDLTIKLENSDLANDAASEEFKDLSSVSIDMGNKKLNFENISNENKAAYVTNYNLKGSEISGKDMIFQSLNGKSIVNGNFKIEGTKDIINDEGQALDDTKISSILIADGYGMHGSLEVNGNFSADKSSLTVAGGNKSGHHIMVNGKANITNSLFSVGTMSFSDLALNNYVFMSASGGFNDDVTTSNTVGANISKNGESIVGMSNKDLGLDYALVRIMNVSDFVDYKLSTNGKDLIINGGANDKVLDNKEVMITEQDYLKLLKTDLEDAKSEDGANIENIDKAIANLDKQIQDIQKLIDEANQNGGAISNDSYVKNDTSISASNKDFVSKILDGLGNSKDYNAVASIKFDKAGEKVANDIKSSAKSISNLNSASSGVNSSINVSNDVSIGSRVAMLNNPYGNYASKLSNLRFAANDIYGQMIDDYKNSIWGNVIGGANIIDGDSGALYGATIGMDRRINDDVILGAYFTYVNAEIKDNLLNQKSDNFQFGVYSNIRVAPKVEVNVKAFGQLSPSDQDIFNSGFNTINSADFTRKFFGLSANVGYVFDFSDNTLFIKPFAGANYYYAHTPSYTESGIAGKDVKSASNNSLSLELGAELRKYMSEESYLFITPKIEQYVLNNGDDFVATLGGVELPSVKSDEKKKTYAQVVIGGNVDISEKFSLNAGIGAKQILAGKVDSKNETYVSGQVGFKYKF